MCLASSLQPPKLFALSCNLIYQHSAQQLYYMHCVEQSASAAVQCKVHKNCAVQSVKWTKIVQRIVECAQAVQWGA